MAEAGATSFLPFLSFPSCDGSRLSGGAGNRSKLRKVAVKYSSALGQAPTLAGFFAFGGMLGEAS